MFHGRDVVLKSLKIGISSVCGHLIRRKVFSDRLSEENFSGDTAVIQIARSGIRCRANDLDRSARDHVSSAVVVGFKEVCIIVCAAVPRDAGNDFFMVSIPGGEPENEAVRVRFLHTSHVIITVPLSCDLILGGVIQSAPGLDFFA